MTREMTGAEMVIEALADQGVKHIFGYPGGAVLPIYDALFAQDKVQHILVRHEQGAVHAAEGYARSTGKVGCVLVTSGPGATNAVTGLTDALMDSIPIVCITGQVPTHLIGNDAFQECDTVGITRPCTKHNYLVKRIEDLPRVLHEAFHIAAERPARPGGGRYPQGHPVRARHLFEAEGFPAHRLQAEGQGRPRQDQGRDRADGACQAAAVLHRRRRDQFRQARERAVARAGQGHRLSHHLDADGPRRFPRRRSAMDGHARHARHARSQHGDARLRRDDLRRRPLRRPHHRPRRRLLARLEEDPHRHRRLLDQQERSRRHPDRRRLRARAGRHGAAVAHRRQAGRQEGARRLVEADRQVARPQVARLSQFQRGDQAAIRHPAALRADQGQGRLHHHRSRPAPDVGGAVLPLPGAEPLDDVRRARHHGLWPAGLGRRAARTSEIAGHRHRRRGRRCR